MTRRRLVTLPGNAVNFVVMINENMVTNFKRRVTPELSVPPLFERAFLFHYEDAVLPFMITFPEDEA